MRGRRRPSARRIAGAPLLSGLTPLLGPAPLLGLALTLGCDSGAHPAPPSAPGDEATPSGFSPADLERRQALRTTLQLELGGDDRGALPFDGTVRWDRGAHLYELLCQGCHGPEGRGDGRVSHQLASPPGDLSVPEEQAFFSARARELIVRRGSPGTPMLGWEEVLEPDDLSAVLKYVSSLQREARR